MWDRLCLIVKHSNYADIAIYVNPIASHFLHTKHIKGIFVRTQRTLCDVRNAVLVELKYEHKTSCQFIKSIMGQTMEELCVLSVSLVDYVIVNYTYKHRKQIY